MTSPPTWLRHLLPPVTCGLAMAVLGGIATFSHSSRWSIGPWQDIPAGIVLACALVVAGALTARAWAGYWGNVAAAAGVFAITQAMSAVGPGGDVLIPALPLGYTWLVLAPTLTVAVAFLPRRWFARPDPSANPCEEEGEHAPPSLRDGDPTSS